MRRDPLEAGARPHAASGKRGQRARAIALLLVGLVLVAAAARVALRAGSSRQALEALHGAPWWAIAALLALPLANLILTAATFGVLTNRHGRVRMGEMTALIASSWLLSAVGMFGRLAYHKVMHGVPVRAAARVLVEALACSGLCVLLLVLLTFLARAAGMSDRSSLLLLLVPVLALAVVAALMRRTVRGDGWRWPAALAFRYLDMGVWAARYLLVFGLLYGRISLVEAAGLAAAAQAAMLLPIQIGAREWVIGLLGMQLAIPMPSAGTAADAVSPGLLADLVNRGAELAVSLPLGVLATLWLVRRWRRHLARTR